MDATAKWRDQRKEAVNWTKEQWQLPSFNNKRKTRVKMIRDSGTCMTMTKDLTFVSLEEEEKEVASEKVFEEIVAETFQIRRQAQIYGFKKLSEYQTGGTQKISMSRHAIVIHVKIKDEKKNPKSCERKPTLLIQEKLFK